MWKPSLGRVHASEAATLAFDTYVDLLPNDRQPAVRSVDGGTPLTFEALKNFISSMALGRLGLGQGDRLCSSMPNGPEAAIAFLAFSPYCSYAPLNPALTRDEVEFEFVDLPAKAVVVRRGESNSVTTSVAKEKGVAVLELVPTGRGVGLFILESSPIRSLQPVPQRMGGRHDICLVLHTSGTTAKPKIVPLHHENLACGALCIASALKLRRDSVNLNVMPCVPPHRARGSLHSLTHTSPQR